MELGEGFGEPCSERRKVTPPLRAVIVNGNNCIVMSHMYFRVSSLVFFFFKKNTVNDICSSKIHDPRLFVF